MVAVATAVRLAMAAAATMGGGHWGGGYYAPGPDYYVAPEPYVYVPRQRRATRRVTRGRGRLLQSASATRHQPLFWTLKARPARPRQARIAVAVRCISAG